MDYDRPKRASCCRVRLIIAILAIFCPIVCYISRQNLSMAIVAMVDDRGPPLIELSTASPSDLTNSSGTWDLDAALEAQQESQASVRDKMQQQHRVDELAPTCPLDLGSDDPDQPRTAGARSYGPKFPWTASERSLVFSGFFWTYVIFQIPAARLAEVAGAKWILVLSAAGSSLLSFVSPWASSVSVYALVLVRALMGVCQTALFPACYVLFAKWLPPVERSLAIPIVNVGAYVGSIFASTLTGYFSEQEQLGWPFAFYTPGVLCALWLIMWLWFGSNTPRDHRSISLEEISYIESKMEPGCNLPGAAKKQISWRKLFTSRSIWVMIATFFASNWSFAIVLLLVPSYLNNILHIPPLKNGLINSVIYVLFCISSPFVGSGSTMMVETRTFGLSRLSIRKLFECVSLFGQAACFVALPLIGCDQNWVLAFLFIQIVLFSLNNGGEVHLPLELSVDFSGTIYAIGNCLGSSTGIIAPFLHSVIVSDPLNRAQWDTFFYLAGVICAIGGLIFLLFGQNHLQDFSKDLHESQLDICAPHKSTSSISLASVSIADKQQHKSAVLHEIYKKREAPPAPALTLATVLPRPASGARPNFNKTHSTNLAATKSDKA